MKGFRPRFKPKQVKKTPVVIMVLTMNQEIKSGLMQFIIHCLGRNSDPSCPWFFTYALVENFRPVEYARNLAVREFRKQMADYPDARLWFIDSDMVPPGNYEEQLRIEADMGAGRAYGIANMQLFTCIQREVEGTLRHLAVDRDASGVVDVDASGTGGLWISKKVLDDERMWLNPEKDVFRTLYHSDGSVKLSEDLDFTHRATKLGYSLKSNLSVKWSHYKEVDLRSLEGGVASAQMQADLARGRAEQSKFKEIA